MADSENARPESDAPDDLHPPLNWSYGGGQTEPSGDIRQVAAHLRQAYNAFREQGFTGEQAAYLVAAVAGGKVYPPQEGQQ